jgi:hypothetical protein
MKKFAIVSLISLVSALPALAQSSVTRAQPSGLIETYRAYIGRDDLRNSNGTRLTQPWQIIRQDRANFYVYGLRDRGDQDDIYFSSKDNRAALEAMLANGSMSREAANMILNGDVWIEVKIYGHGNIGDRIDVTVSD